jgi:hypothetical protein
VQSFAPAYEQLAKRLAPVESVIVARMDGTANEHPSVKEVKVRAVHAELWCA